MSNELVFKLRVDGAAKSATSISQVGEAVDQLGLRGPAAAAALDKLSGTFTASRSAQDAFVSGLRDQIALFGKTASEVERYRAAQLGVGAAAAPLILQLQNQRAAQEAAATAAREEAAALREAASAKKAAESAQASFVRSLQDQVAVQGKSQAEILRYRAAQLGVSKDAEQYIAAIEKSNKSTLGLSISAGQASAALRTLPAQFTDIATQLAGGQSPFLVLLQQGGQIKDSFGGIGNTPDDHTRQAAAAALDVDLVLHPDAEREIRARFGADTTDVRLLLGTFPRGVEIIPNPFNRIPGFRVRDHHFLPGFPQMAHPMAEWVLDTFYAGLFPCRPPVEKAFLLTGVNAYESALLDLMERIVADFPTLRLFSLPSMSEDGQRRYLELGVEGDALLVDAAMTAIRQEIERRAITWQWRQ